MINICKIMDSFSFSNLIVLRAFLLYVHCNKITVGIMVLFPPPPHLDIPDCAMAALVKLGKSISCILDVKPN